MSTSEHLDAEQLDAARRMHALREKRYTMITAAWSLVVLILLTVWSAGFVTWVRWFAR